MILFTIVFSFLLVCGIGLVNKEYNVDLFDIAIYIESCFVFFGEFLTSPDGKLRLERLKQLFKK